MKITIPNKLNTTPRNAMRQCGYIEIYDRRGGQISYVRGLGRGRYPRLHIYINESGDDLLLNLHIDQKQASYEGHTSHSGEYDSEIVLREGERIKRILNKMLITPSGSKIDSDGHKEERGFWGKLFGK
jgi:hypothetical protein